MSLAFRAWFGQSSVRDLTSSRQAPDSVPPTVVYHGTNALFSSFQLPSKGYSSTIFGSYPVTRHALFFTPSRAFAEEFAHQGGRLGGRVIACYLRVVNPLDMQQGLREDDREKLAAQGVNMQWMYHRLGPATAWEAFDDEGGATFVPAAQRVGYDGALLREYDAHGQGHDVWAVFSPRQVKAVENRGTWSRSSADIFEGLGELRWRR